MARQVRRWTKQWDATRDRDRPGLDALAARLAETVPATPAVGHRARRLPARQLPARPGRRPAGSRAVLDWEMSTLGDPLADLGMLFVYWPEAGEDRPATAEPGHRAARLPDPRARSPSATPQRTGPDLSDAELVRRVRLLQVRRDRRRHRRPLGGRRHGGQGHRRLRRPHRPLRGAGTRRARRRCDLTRPAGPRLRTGRRRRSRRFGESVASSTDRTRCGPAAGPGRPAPDRALVRARSGRRPLPPLIFLLVLAVAAAGVWCYVLRQDDGRTPPATAGVELRGRHRRRWSRAR